MNLQDITNSICHLFRLDNNFVEAAALANTKATSAVVEKNRISMAGVISPLLSPSPSPVRVPAWVSAPVTIEQEPISTPSLSPLPTNSGLATLRPALPR
jgi:hypothetical protein